MSGNKKKLSGPSRRDFLWSGIAGSSFIIMGTRASGQIKGSNERLRMAVCGLNGRGGAHIGGFTGQNNVEIAYIVDPDEKTWAKRKKELAGKNNGIHTATAVRDIRKALEDPTLDAVTVATPNHWHSLITIWAAQAGKHVYVEKPMSHDIVEGRVVVEAQKKYGVVIQHGTQRRSSATIAGISKMIKDGKFGRLKISYGYCCKPRGGIGHKPITDPPENLDWTMWKGPAVIDDFHANYVHYNWHWFWKTGNGDLNNQGTHQLDVAQWAIDDDQTHPVKAMAIGGRFEWNDQGETPNTMFAMAEYPNGQSVYFNVRNVNYDKYVREVKNEYYFEDGGWIDSPNDRDYTYYAPGSKEGEKIEVEPGDVTPGGNWGAFVSACRAGKPEMANGNAKVAHYGCVVGHLMNNSYRLGEEVPFNKATGMFGENKDASEHFGRVHDMLKDGVKVPEDKTKYVAGPMLTFDPKTEMFTGDHAEEANRLIKDPDNPGFEVPTAADV